MREDEEGFLYPVVDARACVHCGLCERVCPLRHPGQESAPHKVLVGRNNDIGQRMASSSGGLFVLLAQRTIDRGGVVFGAVFDECWEVRHEWADTMEGVLRMMGSKYVQSRVGTAYRDVRQFLRQGREVLFVGTPCQVAGLHSFLGDQVGERLLLVEILCHGVPGAGVWRRYLAEEFGDAPCDGLSSWNCHLPIAGISFRDKSSGGWKDFHFTLRMQSGQGARHTADFLSEKHYANPFMQGFLANLYLRPSCYECRCKGGRSHADLTIGDYWAARVTDQELDDDHGLSLVLVNTSHGERSLQGLKAQFWDTDMERARLCNGGFCEHTAPHPGREHFFCLLQRGIPMRVAVRKCLARPLSRQVLVRLRFLLRRLLLR